MRQRLGLLAILSLAMVASLALAGCQSGQTEGAQRGDEDTPAKVLPIKGSDVHRVVLTAAAAAKAGIKTEAVRQVTAPDSVGQNLTVPASALVYDNNGGTWVYTSTQPLTFVRQRVTVARIEGDVAVLQAGPAPGTLVASVGAAELLGAENGVAGE